MLNDLINTLVTTDAWIALLEFTIPVMIAGTVGMIMERKEDRRNDNER